MREHVIRVYTDNDTSFLLRNLLIFTRRRVVINNIHFSHDHKGNVLRTDINFRANDLMASNILKQLIKQIDVFKAELLDLEQDVKLMGSHYYLVNGEKPLGKLARVVTKKGGTKKKVKGNYLIEIPSHEEDAEFKNQLAEKGILDSNSTGKIVLKY